MKKAPVKAEWVKVEDSSYTYFRVEHVTGRDTLVTWYILDDYSNSLVEMCENEASELEEVYDEGT